MQWPADLTPAQVHDLDEQLREALSRLGLTPWDERGHKAQRHLAVAGFQYRMACGQLTTGDVSSELDTIAARFKGASRKMREALTALERIRMDERYPLPIEFDDDEWFEQFRELAEGLDEIAQAAANSRHSLPGRKGGRPRVDAKVKFVRRCKWIFERLSTAEQNWSKGRRKVGPLGVML